VGEREGKKLDLSCVEHETRSWESEGRTERRPGESP